MWRWFKSLFAWETDHDSGAWRYSVNRVTGKRSAHRIHNGWSPVDYSWLHGSRDWQVDDAHHSGPCYPGDHYPAECGICLHNTSDCPDYAAAFGGKT